jgi:hypothetical protein
MDKHIQEYWSLFFTKNRTVEQEARFVELVGIFLDQILEDHKEMFIRLKERE